MTTRVLPAVGDPDAARALTTLAAQLPGAEPLPPAADGTRLLETLDQLAAGTPADLPEVVLVHELVGPRPALELIRDVALRFPSVGVVLVTRDTTPGLYSAAMDAGARGVVGLPLAYDELAARVEAAATWAGGVRRHLGHAKGPAPARGVGGTVVSVTGAKGGVGCTLTAVHLALAARASGRDTVLVDMNLQSGDVASFLDVQFRRSVVDLAGIADLTPRVLADAVYTHDTGLALLLAPAEGERGEEVDDHAARQVVAALRARYEVVVVDCGTQMHAANAAAVELADRALLVTTPDVIAVRAAKRMMRLWDRLRARKAEDTLTVVNRASKHTEIQPSLIARIVGTPVARATVPAGFKELHTALDAGRIQDVDDRSSVKQALWTLAAEVGAAAPPQGGNGGGRGGEGKGGRGPRHSRGTPAPPAVSGGTPPPAALPPGAPAAPGRLGSDRGAVALPGWFVRAVGRVAGAPGISGVSGATGISTVAGVAATGTGTAAGRVVATLPGAVAGTGRTGAATGCGRDRATSGAPSPSGGERHRRTPSPAPGGPPPWDGPTQGRRVLGRLRRAVRLPALRESGERDRGALTVEFAGMAPLVLLVLALLWQAVLIGHTFTLAGNAADEGARAATAAAAYGDPAAACAAAAREHLPSAWNSGATVSCSRSGDLWTADVTLPTPALFPGAANLPFTVDGSAGAAAEAD
ncbi:CobQ/CobB/MinD/ParA nucleotide binding domain-containing protein [Streptomyces sp. RKND-216]|nr:AAA family ATPase [Streptomyces sp. RKND-216]THA24754.1 CobQ/CobB/MinD/ParA nucleotide binding domain-containing protein [Streptomyces sp. RKND-216]